MDLCTHVKLRIATVGKLLCALYSYIHALVEVSLFLLPCTQLSSLKGKLKCMYIYTRENMYDHSIVHCKAAYAIMETSFMSHTCTHTCNYAILNYCHY